MEVVDSFSESSVTTTMGESETASGSPARLDEHFDFDLVVELSEEEEEVSSFDFFGDTEEEDVSNLRFWAAEGAAAACEDSNCDFRYHFHTGYTAFARVSIFHIPVQRPRSGQKASISDRTQLRTMEEAPDQLVGARFLSSKELKAARMWPRTPATSASEKALPSRCWRKKMLEFESSEIVARSESAFLMSSGTQYIETVHLIYD
jgi:hypothetical protein